MVQVPAVEALRGGDGGVDFQRQEVDGELAKTTPVFFKAAPFKLKIAG